jgi:intracellular sulfur oxidation DsrE/DsrF family protein
MTIKLASVVLLAIAIPATPRSVAAQRLSGGSAEAGPIIRSAGQSAIVENPTFRIPDGHVFKAVYVIDRADTATVNQQLNTVARFLNLHARNGIPSERLQAAAVVHGSGWRSLLTDSAYGARYGGKANPSKRLVEELLSNGVQLVLCGQTAAFRGVKHDELLPGVQLAISAMTALNVFQAQGYHFNPW